MTDLPSTPENRKVPVYLFDIEQVTALFAVVAAMRQREDMQPELAENPFWQSLKKLAFDDFLAAYTVDEQ